MTNPQRNIAIVLIVLLTASLTGAQPTTDAIVSAIDRNTRAQRDPVWVLSNGHVLYDNGMVCGPRPKWYGTFVTGQCYDTEELCHQVQEQAREARNKFYGDFMRAKFTLEQLEAARKALGLDE